MIIYNIYKRTYDNIRKIATGQGDQKDLSYLKNCCKIIATDLSKQQELDADPKANQQINFTGNLNRNVIIITEKAKKRFWIFHKEL